MAVVAVSQDVSCNVIVKTLHVVARKGIIDLDTSQEARILTREDSRRLRCALLSSSLGQGFAGQRDQIRILMLDKDRGEE